MPWIWKEAVVWGLGVAAAVGVGFVTYRVYQRRKRGRKSEILATLSELGDLDFVYLSDHAWTKARRMGSAELPGGSAHLQVVSDFDMTLTRCRDENGERYATCHAVIETSSLVPDWYRVETRRLKDHFFPLEYSPTLSHDEKAVLMDEWWEKAHDSLIRSNVRREDLTTMVRESTITFRSGIGELMKFLVDRDVPMCIVSAGIADVLSEAISQDVGTFGNTSVVSNVMQFDESGVLCGFSEPVIHSYNKAGAVDQHCDFHTGDRYNIVLLGDSLGDIQMVPVDQSLPEHFTVLRIGFLNDLSNPLLVEKYKSAYDVLILGDRDLDVVNRIIKSLGS